MLQPDVQPQIRLFLNPWPLSVTDAVLLKILEDAASVGYETLTSWIDRGEVNVENGDGPFACVLLDPTNVNVGDPIRRRILAMVLYGGKEAEPFIPNAAAKADAHARHRRPNGELVAAANFCLSDDDFAWGTSAEYEGAVAGGSGLSVRQDGQLALEIVTDAMRAVHIHRAGQISHLRKENRGHAWYNQANCPGREYEDLAKLIDHSEMPLRYHGPA